MESPHDTAGNYEVALSAAEKGIVAVPCHPGTKVPMVRWKEWQAAAPPADLLRQWFADTRVNIGIVCTGMVLFDCDDPAKADLVLAECGDTPHKVRTPRGGVHLGYRRRKGTRVQNLVKIKGQPIDIRTDGGIEVIPNSRTEHGRYEWLGGGLSPIAELPVARVGWTRERARRRPRLAFQAPGAGEGRIRFPEAYCLKIASVQGENGSRALVRVVCILRDAGRSPDQAFAYIMGPWNATCARPPWSEREVRHAIDRHYGRRSGAPRAPPLPSHG